MGRGGGDTKKSPSGFQQGDAAEASRLVPRIGGELHAEAWKGGVRPEFVLLDLGLTQKQGNYASGAIFQAVLVEGVSVFVREYNVVYLVSSTFFMALRVICSTD